MNNIGKLLSISFILTTASVLPAISQKDNPAFLKQLKIHGYVGGRIDDCITHRVKAQDVDHLVEPFRHKNEERRWQSEFWGKWIQGAIASYRYNKDPELYKIIQNAVDELIATQLPNGYIGNYAPQFQLQQWDVWGRKYCTLGLLAYYDLSGDKKALDAARKEIDYLMTQVGPGKVNIISTGNYHGMASSSVLEPVVYLYNFTADRKYLDFAKYIVSEWETPDGPQLIRKAIEDIPVSKRFPHPATWFSKENGQKAYEMMSCYEGLLELYKITGNSLYLAAVEKTVSNIISDEINIAGSGSAFECWYGGAANQTVPTYHTMETCVTFTWMQLCNRLLRMTGNSLYADYMESSIYNALMASLKDDASQIAKYSPLEGTRTEGEEQCEMHINCCNANGPRAFAMIPDFMYQEGDNRININFYAPSEAQIAIGKNQVEITQTTSYPESDKIEISVVPVKSSIFTMALRIPNWSVRNVLAVNGETQNVEMLPGSYALIERKWNKGDKITLTLDLRGRLLEKNQSQAIMRGPVVLARDSRFDDGFVELTPANGNFAWMNFTVPMTMGTDLEGKEGVKQIRLCDFASAGNTWDKSVRYKVWLPKTLNVIQQPYKPYNY